jgi:D-alanyl-D-alanine endopeptidase (penicillin-binding protein 7)
VTEGTAVTARIARAPARHGSSRVRATLALVLAFGVVSLALPLPDATAAAKTTAKTTPKKKTKKKRRLGPASGSKAALVMDSSTGDILYEKNGGQTRSIASLTKLMTAMVFLETEPDLSRSVKVERADLRGSGKTQLRSGEVVTMESLLYHSLMASDNAATRTLVRESGLTREEFLARMNRKASILGLNATHFVEFTGLDAGNVSSAYDLANLMRHALKYPEIALVTSQPDYTYRSSRRSHYLVNTNRLARYGSVEVRGGKTGYIRASGYCLATCVREAGRELISIVLGSPSNRARFNETSILLGKVKTDLSNQEFVESIEVSPGG